MKLFSRFASRFLSMTICLFGSASAWSESTILSGMFDGAEPVIDQYPTYRCNRDRLGYRQSTFKVSIGGVYTLYDAFGQIHRYGGVDIAYWVYEGSFNAGNLAQNRKKSLVESSSYNFTAGTDYVLVVQHRCENVEGAWAMFFLGPGTIQSSSAVAVPSFTKGRFTQYDPTMALSTWSDEKAPYKQSGPIRVSRDGTYYFSDSLMDSQVSLRVYTAPVDPANPEANQVAFAAYGAQLVELQAGQDYYFVTQWINGLRFPADKYGEFMYVLAPPAPFRINPGLNGSWYNPDTPGQGFFLTVYETLNKVFLGWFTYADEPLPGDTFGHRWMTALGPFAGTSAQLGVDMTAGGSFDAAQPAPERSRNGTIELTFTDCSSGEIRYDLGDDTGTLPPVSGVIPIRRLANDAGALCESLYPGPGMPGPL